MILVYSSVWSEHVVLYPYAFEKADEPSRLLCLFRTFSLSGLAVKLSLSGFCNQHNGTKYFQLLSGRLQLACEKFIQKRSLLVGADQYSCVSWPGKPEGIDPC